MIGGNPKGVKDGKRVMDRGRLVNTLKRHEGLRLKPYKDSVGKTTIGIGRNLDDVGITENEAIYLLNNDIDKAYREARSFWWFDSLNSVRQEVVVNMIFNLGFPTFSQFKNTIKAISEQNWNLASQEMLDSRWASQVGRRAIELADAMRRGEWD